MRGVGSRGPRWVTLGFRRWYRFVDGGFGRRYRFVIGIPRKQRYRFHNWEMAYLCETRLFILRSQGFQAWSKSTIPVPVTFAVVSVPVGVGGGAVTGSAGPVPSIVTHGTRIGPIATAIGAGVRAGAASVAIVVHRVVVVVQPRRSGAVVRGLKYAIFGSSYRKKTGRPA